MPSHLQSVLAEAAAAAPAGPEVVQRVRRPHGGPDSSFGALATRSIDESAASFWAPASASRSSARARKLGSFLDTSFQSFGMEGEPGQPGCLNRERPCPEVDVTAASILNQRAPPKGAMSGHQECCNAINRSKQAAQKAESLVNNNYYLRYLMAAPVDLEPVVTMLIGWWGSRRREESEAEEARDTTA
eukprot:TRINITY_DN122183_c0_g1_i1.p1 TRINITY_DN122183_c0_g1~~TRINITY_DN122183_c0_g1_i1.p1  ORF type:complete len:188 (-),score=36.49 TRINITY_DN122183_c0_g1_i1:129-692(-)